MFVKENVNPKKKKTTDCVVRAITKASRKSYNDVLDLLVEKMKETGICFSDSKCSEAVLLNLGFKAVSCSKVAKGEKRPKVADIAKLTENNKKRIVCNCAGHLTEVEAGNIYDLWDCSDKAVYKYFVIES